MRTRNFALAILMAGALSTHTATVKAQSLFQSLCGGGSACDTSCDSMCSFDGCCDSIGCEAICDYDWSGTYVGGSLGWSWLDPGSDQPNLIQPSSNGFVGGGFIGRNFQYNRIVFGLESDFYLGDLTDTDPCFNPLFTCNARSEWNASFRGRLGLAMDRTLFFTTMGYALTEYEGFTRLLAVDQTFSDDETLDGFAVGCGIEHAVSKNILLRAEYRHENFGSTNLAYDETYRVNPKIDMLLFGAAWKF